MRLRVLASGSSCCGESLGGGVFVAGGGGGGASDCSAGGAGPLSAWLTAGVFWGSGADGVTVRVVCVERSGSGRTFSLAGTLFSEACSASSGSGRGGSLLSAAGCRGGVGTAAGAG